MEAIDALAEMVYQHCNQWEPGVWESGFIRASADAMRTLVAAGVMRWTDHEDGTNSRQVYATFLDANRFPARKKPTVAERLSTPREG